MNPEEQETMHLIDLSEQVIDDKYSKKKQASKVEEYYQQYFPIKKLPDLHLKLLIWISLFISLMIIYSQALPIPATPNYPKNMFNDLFTWLSFAWFSWIPLVLGYELGKRRKT